MSGTRYDCPVISGNSRTLPRGRPGGMGSPVQVHTAPPLSSLRWVPADGGTSGALDTDAGEGVRTKDGTPDLGVLVTPEGSVRRCQHFCPRTLTPPPSPLSSASFAFGPWTRPGVPAYSQGSRCRVATEPFPYHTRHERLKDDGPGGMWRDGRRKLSRFSSYV